MVRVGKTVMAFEALEHSITMLSPYGVDDLFEKGSDAKGLVTGEVGWNLYRLHRAPGRFW